MLIICKEALMEGRSEQQFGDYRLVKLVGEGGFGKVHLARSLHSDTEVAIKILDTQLISREREDFLQEARVIASLNHPSIVRLLDCGIEDDKPFLTMNYASNGTLRQRHPKGSRVPLQQVVSYVKPIASALYYAHERRLIHRDVKPENMLLGNHDEVLLGDFGIALISSSSTSRSTKTAAGTVSYMAPEQILGKPCIASDQYALGIVVYEWLCGTLPFPGSFAEVGQQHLYAPPPSFEEQGVEIAPSVEAVVRKALAKKPDERFADVQEFAIALEESFLRPETALTSVSVLPRTESDVVISVQGPNRRQGELTGVRKTTEPLAPAVPAPLVTTGRRSGVRRNLIGVLCLLLLVLLVTSTVLYRSLPAARSATPSSTTRTSTVGQPTLVPTVQPTIVPTSVSTAQPTTVPTSVSTAQPTTAPTSVSTTQPTTAPTSVSTTQPTTVPAPIPSNANSNCAMFGYNLQHTHYNPNETTINASNVSQLTLDWTASVSTYASPVYANGIVYVPGYNGSLYAFNANTGGTLWVTPLSTSWINITVAVAGGIVYVGTDDGKLNALNASTGAILWTSTANNVFVNSSPALANGIVYIGTDNGTFYAFNATTGATLWTFTATSTKLASITAPAVVNGIVYFSSDNGSVYALDATTGALKWSTPIPSLYFSAPAVVNGILYIGANNLYALNANTGAIIWVSAANKGFSSSPAVVNGIVYVGSYDHNIYAFNATTGAVIWNYTTGGVMIYPSPLVIPGVVFMGSDDYTFYALDASTGAKLWSFHLGSFVEGEPAVANGIVYLVGTRNGTLYAFHLPAGSTGTTGSC
jgi:outer membrane protein assembly factor BamB/tRNA A-37 threonylcarbamoyl transferase component Bud32